MAATTAAEMRAEAAAREALTRYAARERRPEVGAALVEARDVFARVSATFDGDPAFKPGDRYLVLAEALDAWARAAVQRAEADREQATKAQISGAVEGLHRELDRLVAKV